MNPQPSREEILARLADAFSGTPLTKEEFVKSFKNVVDIVLKLKAANAEEMKAMHAACDEAIATLEQTTETTMEGFRAEFATALQQIADKLATVKDGKDGDPGAPGTPGKDADTEQVIREVLAAIKLPENIVLDGPEEIRNKLELLQGDERLTIDAIKDLREELEALKKQRGSVIQGGIIGRDLIKDYDLSSQLDGVTKTFNLPAVWNIVSVDLSSFPHALRKNIDYTYTQTSITFTSQIDAATSLATGQTCVLTIVSA